MEERLLDLKNIISSNPSIIDNRKQLSGIIADCYPGNRLKVNTLLMVYDAGIVDELNTSKSIDNFTFARYKKVLSDDFGLADALSADIILEWCVILSVDNNVEEEITSPAEEIDLASTQSNSISFDGFIPLFKDILGADTDDMENEYFENLQRIDINSKDYKARNSLIELLYSKSGLQAYEQFFLTYNPSAEELRIIKGNRKRTFEKLRDIVYGYRKKEVGTPLQASRMEAWSLLMDAECSMYMGDLVRALLSYKEFLNHPVVLKSIRRMDEDKWWTDEFSSDDATEILRVLHNMSAIFEWVELPEKSKKWYSKYKNIVQYKLESTQRMCQQQTLQDNVKEYIEDETNKLCGFVKEDVVYTIGSTLFAAVLNIYMENPEEPARIDLDNKSNYFDDCVEVRFDDGIYEYGYASFCFDDVNIDIQKEKIKILF